MQTVSAPVASVAVETALASGVVETAFASVAVRGEAAEVGREAVQDEAVAASAVPVADDRFGFP